MALSALELKSRILLDFNQSYDDVLAQIKEIMPNVTSDQISEWHKDKSLEYINIDGKRLYFRRAARNVFRINKRAREFYFDKYGDDKAGRALFLSSHIPDIIRGDVEKKYKFSFRLTLKPNFVPNGETVRCWLPYPIESVYQNILDTDKTGIYQDTIHSSKYFEKTAKRNEALNFDIQYKFSSKSFFYKRNSTLESMVVDNFIKEQCPHIVFSEKIIKLSKEIVGEETNKFIIAKRIFSWISENIPWAVAREYSTIDNIPEYVINNRHGDCGQVTLLFMTLCRYNAIPSRWISGFMLHPNYENLHDWCEIYLENIGWMPVDVSFGVQNWTTDDDMKYFYFGGIDAYRLIINRGISGDFNPPKKYPRSETVDFQRGEVEWSKDNLYFNHFSYDFKVEEIDD